MGVAYPRAETGSIADDPSDEYKIKTSAGDDKVSSALVFSVSNLHP